MIYAIDKCADLVHNEAMNDLPPLFDVFWPHRTIRFFLDQPIPPWQTAITSLSRQISTQPAWLGPRAATATTAWRATSLLAALWPSASQ
jgi:hypothetical protein